LSGGVDRQGQVQRDRAARAKPQSPHRESRERDAAQELNAESPGKGYRTGPDTRRMPDNYDPDMWKLALAFMDAAEFYGVELEVSSYRTYALLLRRIGKTKLREKHENWVKIVDAMIKEFWKNDVDLGDEAWAINQFTGIDTFRGLAQWAIGKLTQRPVGHVNEIERADTPQRQARRAAAKAKRDAQPVPAREPRTYTDEGAAELRAHARTKIDELKQKWGFE
jgi:hypothetical protein